MKIKCILTNSEDYKSFCGLENSIYTVKISKQYKYWYYDLCDMIDFYSDSSVKLIFNVLNDDSVELNNLAVLPEYRHLGIGKELVDYAITYSKNTIGASKISIGIVEDNLVLKEWYEELGFIHIGTKKFEHLPFTVGFMEIKL